MRDGVFFVDLSALHDPTVVPSAMADALGLREVGPQDAREIVLAHLRDRRALRGLVSPRSALGAVQRLVLAQEQRLQRQYGHWNW